MLRVPAEWVGLGSCAVASTMVTYGRNMLTSFCIRGFRGFDLLEVPALGQVNLLVARNNAGKTTVLEALKLHAAGEFAGLEALELLERRDEIALEHQPSLSAISRLFHNGRSDQTIELGTLPSGSDTLRLELGWSMPAKEQEDPRARVLAPGPPPPGEEENYHRVLVTSSNAFRRMTAIDALDSVRRRVSYSRDRFIRGGSSFVRAHGFQGSEAAQLWDLVALSEAENDVIRALQIVEPSVERVTYVGEPGPRLRRIPVAKCKGRNAEPLKSMGDGMNRIFEIVLALVSTRGGLLLVDELENGIHYSVQADLWRVIFATATRLGIQVFAATHSWDCIQAFQRAAAEHPSEGVLVRIERSAEGTRSFVFSEAELAIVTRDSIEVR